MTQGANVTTVAYDANGNLSTETLGAAVTTYQYDPENRLTGIANPDATRSTYTYSATGLRRTAQEPGGTQTLFVWDGDDYLQERAASTVLYVVQDGKILAGKRSGSRNWYVPDPLGSTSLLLDATLNVTDRFEYWPYGEERTHVGSSVTPFRYVGTLGYYRDASGRIYVRARVLRPDYGRWLTDDPIAFEGGDWNVYGYVGSGPVGGVDPSGLIIPILCTGACIAVLGCAGGIWYACRDWRVAYDSWWDCASEFVRELPWYSRLGCEVGLAGCLVCLWRGIGQVRNAIRPPVERIRFPMPRWTRPCPWPRNPIGMGGCFVGCTAASRHPGGTPASNYALWRDCMKGCVVMFW